MPITFKAEDRRTVACPVPASAEDTHMLGQHIMEAPANGYILKDAETVQGGSQRDPYAIGVRLIFEKK